MRRPLPWYTRSLQAFHETIDRAFHAHAEAILSLQDSLVATDQKIEQVNRNADAVQNGLGRQVLSLQDQVGSYPTQARESVLLAGGGLRDLHLT